jgi:hypothetical protein
LQWDSLYSNSIVIDLPRYEFDHCPLMLHISLYSVQPSNIFRFDATWIEIEELNLLAVKWWFEYKLTGDIEDSWHKKFKYMKKKKLV